jgi:sugar/nucleoside kinase (ribokinase family)
MSPAMSPVTTRRTSGDFAADRRYEYASGAFDDRDFEAAADLARQEVALAALTRSAAGSVIIAGEERHEVAAVPAKVVDTTGAGDAYAAGFLAAYTRGLTLPECGRWGSAAAAEVISHFGARPQANLKALIVAGAGNRPVSAVLG